MSDPPGISQYYNMGVDKDGLHCYHTVQGTNSVEGNIHMPLQRMFGSLHASPELSDALLCNSCDRRNTTVSCKIYLSLTLVSHSLSGCSFQLYWKKWSGHHDTYRSDEIVKLAADVGISPSFPIPEILSTCIATKEPFGIIPVPEKITE